MLVAVKVLHSSVTEVMEDFQRECAILERLRHSHVIMYLGMASNAEGQVRLVSLSSARHAGLSLGVHCVCRDKAMRRRLAPQHYIGNCIAAWSIPW